MSEHKYNDAYSKGFEAGKKQAFTEYCMQCYDELSKYEQAKLMVEWGADIPKSCEAKCLDCLLTEKVVIKDNITNGDVIKAMFPNASMYEQTPTMTYYGMMRFDTEWWNAKYKAVKEDKYCDRNVCASNEYNGIGCDECVYNPTESEDKNE